MFVFIPINLNHVLQRLLHITGDLLCIAVFLAENTAAVLLHIKPQFTSLLLACAKARTEVPIQKSHAPFLRSLTGDVCHALVLLIGADEQGGSETVKTVFGGKSRRLLQTHFIALCAAVGNIVSHGTHKIPQAVLLLHDQLHFYESGVLYEGVPPRLVLLIGVNVGIEPVGHRLDALCAQLLHAGNGARGAAGMQ